MKNLMIALLALGFSSTAFADGFKCETVDGVYSIKMYNHTGAENGTRNGAIMIISDNTISSGRKTIAKFDADNALLDNSGATYVADVDLRYNDSARQGEIFVGTKLGQIDTIKVDVDFSYGAPVEAGSELDGHLVVTKRNGQKIRAKLECVRYLKN